MYNIIIMMYKNSFYTCILEIKKIDGTEFITIQFRQHITHIKLTSDNKPNLFLE